MEEVKNKGKEEAKIEKQRKKEEKEARKQEAKKAKSGKGVGIVAVLVSLVVAGVVAFTIFSLERAMLADYATANVVVAIADVTAGVDLSEENVANYFAVQEVPADMVPEGAYTDVNAMVDQFVATDIKAKEIPVASNFTNMAALDIENPVETSFSLSDVSQVVAGTLRRGDEISISVTNPSNSALNGIVLEHVLIKEAYSADGVVLNVGDAGQATMFTVIISQEDEQTLNSVLASGGTIRIAQTNNIQY